MVLSDVTQSKRELRARIHAARRQLSPEAVRAASDRICERLVRLGPFEEAGGVGCYLALPQEVQTMGFVDRCWELGKRVCVPAWDESRRAYGLSWLEPGQPTVPGHFGITEPAAARWVGPGEVDFIVVPGVAFDRSGRRLGQGGGHYDRLLAACRGFKAGVAFEVQLVEEVPVTRGDVAVDVVVTERGVYPSREQPRGG